MDKGREVFKSGGGRCLWRRSAGERGAKGGSLPRRGGRGGTLDADADATPLPTDGLTLTFRYLNL